MASPQRAEAIRRSTTRPTNGSAWKASAATFGGRTNQRNRPASWVGSSSAEDCPVPVRLASSKTAICPAIPARNASSTAQRTLLLTAEDQRGQLLAASIGKL